MRLAACVLVLSACQGAPSPVVTLATTTTPQPLAAQPTARARVAIDGVVGTFRCLGWLPARNVALCFVGSTSVGEASQVSATIVALDGKAHGPAVPRVLGSRDLKEAEVPRDALEKLRANARDLVRWDEQKVIGKKATIGSLTFTTRSTQTDAGGDNMAPRIRWELILRDGTKEHAVDTSEGAISEYDVTAYRAEGTTVRLRTYSIADEGQYENALRLRPHRSGRALCNIRLICNQQSLDVVRVT